VSRRIAAGLLAVTLAGGGCSVLLPGSVAVDPCAANFTPARCEAIGVWAAEALGVAPEQVASIGIVAPTPDPDPAVGRGAPVSLRVVVADGSTRELTLQCFGVAGAFLPECMPEPAIELQIPARDNYRDLPVGSTPMPALDPEAEALAVPLDLPRIEIPIDHAGEQRVVLGEATLANGMIREVKAALGEPWPASVVLRSAIHFEIRPKSGGEPIENMYLHGWRKGVEVVEVSIVFDAAILRPGAHLTLVGVLVR
jgi:hypothetical protein